MQTPLRTSDVVIAGAGIIGLSAALELAAAGLRVTVLEQAAAMRGASWAAAGMLAAHDPENPPGLRALSDLSLALYPGFLDEVEQRSGKRIALRTSGALQALDPGHRAADGELLGEAALRARVPGLSLSARRFVWLDEHSLDPRDLFRALPLAVQQAGVTVIEGTRVLAVRRSGERVRIETEDGHAYLANHYVHCCGAWSALPELAETPLPVEPRKGQMLALTMPPDAPALGCVVRTPELYLVPRGDGRVIVGATVERAGFDRTLTRAAAEWLLAAAAELWPPILEGRVTEQWAGLRPWTPDSLPILGPVADVPGGAGQWVATGHYRNGILLAPATARLLRELISGEPPAIDLVPFRPARFAAVAAGS